MLQSEYRCFNLGNDLSHHSSRPRWINKEMQILNSIDRKHDIQNQNELWVGMTSSQDFTLCSQ